MTEQTFTHGLQGYIRYHCRCDICKAAKAEAQKRYRKNTMTPESKAKQRAAQQRYLAKQRKNVQAGSHSEAALLPSDWTY